MSKIVVDKLSVLQHKLDLTPEMSKVIPNNLFVKETVTVEFHNCAIEYVNGIRGVLCTEVNSKCLACKENSIETNDKSIIKHELTLRIRQISILQSVKMDATFKLNKTNSSDSVINIYSHDIVNSKEAVVFEKNIILMRLMPGKTIRINNIYIEEGNGRTNARHMLCSGIPVCKSIGLEYYNSYTGTGVKSSEVDPKSNQLIFTTNGNIDSIELLKRAIEALISKIKKLFDYVTIITVGEKNEVYLNGQTYTVANILTEAIDHVEPQLKYNSNCEDYNNSISVYKLTVIGNFDINKLLVDAQNYALENLNHINSKIL